MNTETFTTDGYSLASRRAAVAEREKLASAIRRGSTVAYDLSTVVSISSSYADEMFGVLVIEFGLEKTLDSVKVVGAHKGVLRVIAEAMKERIPASAA